MFVNFALAALLAFSAPQRLEFARQLTIQKMYEESNVVLNTTPYNRETYSTYHALRMFNHFALRQKAPAMASAKAIEDSFDPVPTRYRHLAQQLIDEMNTWKEGDLPDISRDMREVADRLETAKGGEKTQDLQKQILKKLDKLIKEEEDKKNQQANAGKGQQPGDPDKKPGSGQGNQPLDDSKIAEMVGNGKIDDKLLRKIGERWGSLPDATRSKVIQELTKDVPPKFKAQIEAYFKSLNKLPGSGTTPPPK